MNPAATPGFIQQLGWLDLGALIILGFFLVMGLLRGFVWQVVQFAKLVGGIVLANLFATTVGGWITSDKLQPPYSTYLAYVLIFLGFAIVMTIVAKLLEESLKKMELKSYDRLAGAALGLASGWLMLTVVVMFLYSRPPLDSTRNDNSTSYAGAYAARTALVAGPMLPAEVKQLYERIVDPSSVTKLADETKDKRIHIVTPPAPPPPPVPPPGGGK